MDLYLNVLLLLVGLVFLLRVKNTLHHLMGVGILFPIYPTK